ncbi:MAG TPA: ATP-binding protein [Nitrososphaeraceae archaeon]|nr:ATP-binding protein [Nitrososphaeraceae archaeon]
MLKHDANAFRLIRSKIGLKIAILVVIQIIFIITSFSVLSYYESQGTYLGNSINIAGKNRFLTSNLMLQISEYFMAGSSSNNDVSKINSAIDQLETNILALREGGKISDVDLKPLPSEFLDHWNTIYQKWVSLKTTITNNIIKPNEKINPSAAATTTTTTTTTIDKDVKTTLDTRAVSLVDSSNSLVTHLGEYAGNSSQNLIFLQAIFAVLNIAVAIVVLYLVMRILKPIFALTTATSEISRGNLDVSVKSRGNNDELSILSDSFNFMVNSIKNYVNKQNQLTKKLKDANEELKNNDRLKDEFINVAAHELRSPIQPILGLSEFLRSNKGRETSSISSSSNSAAMSLEKEEELLDVIVRNSKRLRQLAEDILDVAKIEGGSLFLKKEKVNIKEMITEILSEYEQKIKNIKNIKLSYYSQGNDSITIEADRSRLCQVIYNLLSNAVKFTNDGSITVIAEKKDKDDNFIILSIHDTGIGIDSEMLPKLFSKFATKSQTGGTGLGLFISKSIIEKHGGKMWAENNSDAKGATFAFSLPIN